MIALPIAKSKLIFKIIKNLKFCVAKYISKFNYCYNITTLRELHKTVTLTNILH